MGKVEVYAGCMKECIRLLEPFGKAGSVWSGEELNAVKAWPDGGSNQMLFQSDTAYEFGGSGKAAVGGLILTEDELLVREDEVRLIGPDVCDIHANAPYARLALVRMNPEKIGTEKDLYKDIRKIEYTRYHVNPEGFMVRISAMNHKEAVRIGKSAVRAQISFQNVGKSYIEEFRKHPAIEAVRMIFITDPVFPYRELEKIVNKSEAITKTLDHLLTKVKMDCDTCGLKVICDEVEQLLPEGSG